MEWLLLFVVIAALFLGLRRARWFRSERSRARAWSLTRYSSKTLRADKFIRTRGWGRRR